ncbi:fggy-family carbohydrate kinase [Lasallia pustulata]|uniref:Fggy-family carbohydrate kinase n=1 Tax=Lasallia pustulata TaxID=136370 RepID=A0A1W5D6E9_9LECA|nr:fggy-family carbohydrate kinase [Lasallia pustulata]
MDHYVGIDVGTGSARACVINSRGDIVGVASENIGLWQPQQGFYEQSTNDIWRCICTSIQRVLSQHNINPVSIRGMGFDATCSLAVFAHDTDEPVSVTGPKFDNDHNIILWLDHRPIEETEKINATKHNLLRYVGGTMSIEMEIPKVLWLKNHMPKGLFDRCKFYDLADALTHIATGNETRSFCSTVCKQGFIPVGVDGSVKGWQGDFLTEIGLGELTEDNFKRLGGVNGVNGKYLSAGELVGTLSKKAAHEMGLPAGIAIGSGVIDAYAGWVGTVGSKVSLRSQELSSGVADNDKSQVFTRLAAVAGTSTCHLAMSPDPVFVPGVWGPYRDVLMPDYWMAEGGQSATGELLKHVIETHPSYQEAVSIAETYNTNIYDYLNEHLKDMQVKAKAPTLSWLGRHFFFYGDLFGNRSPIADPRMSGSVIGLSSDRSIDGLALYYYGTMEFIALQTHQIIETMNKAGHHISSIFMSGSQCQNSVLMSLMASACDMPVLIPQYVHAAVVHGAAMLGAKAASADKEGKTEPLWEIMDRMSKPGKAVHPTTDPHEKELLAVKYKVFLEQCEKQREYRKDVDDVIAKWGNVASQPSKEAGEGATSTGDANEKAAQLAGEKEKSSSSINLKLPMA